MSHIKDGFTIVRIQPEGYVHHRAFDEITTSLEGSLRKLGLTVIVVDNKFNLEGTNIVLGAHLLHPKDMQIIPKNTIIYNFELLYSGNRKFISQEYLSALAENYYWDYSLKNIEEMKSFFPDIKPTHVPVGGFDLPLRVSTTYEDEIDVLFYGSLNPRRQKILKELESKGVNVKSAFGVYGEERDELILRSKLIINIHQHEVNVLETVRLSYLMTNCKAIVSECNIDTEVPEFMRPGLKLVPYDNLVDACLELLADEEAIASLEQDARDAMMSKSYSDILLDALDDADLYVNYGSMTTIPAIDPDVDTISLDLGCGNYPRNPYQAKEVYGVDIIETGNDGVKVADLNIEPIPFEDSSLDFVTAFDFLEHVPRVIYINGKKRQPFIELMNEIWRVLKPGGVFRAHTPAYPKVEAFVDPTHVNFITEDTVNYFCRGSGVDSFGKMYGFTGAFQKLDVRWDENYKYHLVWELRAIK